MWNLKNKNKTKDKKNKPSSQIKRFMVPEERAVGGVSKMSGSGQKQQKKNPVTH